MKTILQLSPAEEVTYSMPADIFELVSGGLRYRLFRTVADALAALPVELRRQVTQSPRPTRKPVIRGAAASMVLIDEVAFPDDEPLRFGSQYQCSFWNEIPTKDKAARPDRGPQ